VEWDEDVGVLVHPPIDDKPLEVVETNPRRRGLGIQTIRIYNTLVVQKCHFDTWQGFNDGLPVHFGL
jgi:hypothetical protein